MKPYPDEPKVVPGSTLLTEQMADELEQHFGVRYHSIQNSDPRMNRKQRRRMKLKRTR